jgi:hypothetical protein
LQALQKELLRLERVSTWFPTPFPTAVARNIKDSKHSRLFDIRSLKHSELGDAGAQRKARIVVLGNQVHNGHGEAAFFDETASTPTSMSAIRMLLAYGLASSPEGDSGTSTADAEQAFVQPMLPDSELVFVQIPDHLLTVAMREALAKANLVNSKATWRLRRPLYGLSCAGVYWERHLSLQLSKIGFQPVEGWPQTWSRRLPCGSVQLLTSYVDDLLLAGPHHMSAWPEIQKLIACSTPAPVTRLLGVNHSFTTGRDASVTFSMKDFAQQAVDAFVAGGGKLSAREASCPWLQISPQQLVSPELMAPGRYADKAASFLMKALWLARCQRADLLFSISALARDIHAWTVASDMRMERLYSYIAATVSHSLVGRVKKGSIPKLRSWVDSDWGGCEKTARSTSGSWLELVYEDGVTFPVDYGSARQTATSSSSTEAEVVALSKVMRDKALPLEVLVSSAYLKDCSSEFMEDNSAALLAAKRGYSLLLRHLAKHQRVALSACADVLATRTITQVPTKIQKADVLTKGLGPADHAAALKMLNIQSVP